MNKTALLDMVHQFSAISDQDVEELEKLARSFPYCQTAHLLIAKASYDKGNMLSNQKLRKAAAYAINRHLLKKLIYTTETAVVLTEIEPEAKTPAIVPVSDAPETSSTVLEAVSEFLLPAPPHTFVEFHQTEIPADLLTTDTIPEPAPEKEENSQTVPMEPVVVLEGEESNAADYEGYINIDDTKSENIVFDPSANVPVEISFPNEAEMETVPLESSPESAFVFSSLELDDLLQVENLTRAHLAKDEPGNILPEPEEANSEIQIQVSEEGETQTFLAPIIRYELEAADESEEFHLDQTLASFDSYLFKPEKDEPLVGDLKPATPDEFIYEVYTRNSLGYWMGSSRLGEVLQVKDELTTHTPLQFYPDLILEYSKQNYLTPTDPPKVTNVSRQLEIIDQFLKANPKLKSFAPDKVRPEPMDDLAFKSTKNTKNLASENLANIMVQQGKIKKAIKIYEHLILKIPEKKAYFTAQIEKLRNLI